MRDLLLQVAERAGHYLEALEHRPVFPDAQAVARIDTLDQPLPDEGVSPELVLKELEEVLFTCDGRLRRPTVLWFRHRRLFAERFSSQLAGYRMGPERL